MNTSSMISETTFNRHICCNQNWALALILMYAKSHPDFRLWRSTSDLWFLDWDAFEKVCAHISIKFSSTESWNVDSVLMLASVSCITRRCERPGNLLRHSMHRQLSKSGSTYGIVWCTSSRGKNKCSIKYLKLLYILNSVSILVFCYKIAEEIYKVTIYYRSYGISVLRTY